MLIFGKLVLRNHFPKSVLTKSIRDDSALSDTAKDFIEKLLVVNQDNRMSADEALLHPWLSSSTCCSQWAQN